MPPKRDPSWSEILFHPRVEGDIVLEPPSDGADAAKHTDDDTESDGPAWKEIFFRPSSERVYSEQELMHEEAAMRNKRRAELVAQAAYKKSSEKAAVRKAAIVPLFVTRLQARFRGAKARALAEQQAQPGIHVAEQATSTTEPSSTAEEERAPPHEPRESRRTCTLEALDFVPVAHRDELPPPPDSPPDGALAAAAATGAARQGEPGQSLARVASFTPAGSDVALDAPSLAPEARCAGTARATAAEAEDEAPEPSYSDQPDGWNVTSMRIGANDEVAAKVRLLGQGRSEREALGVVDSAPPPPPPQKVASFTEAFADDPRAATVGEVLPPSHRALAEPADEPPQPAYGEQPEGWHATSLRIDGSRQAALRIQAVRRGRSSRVLPAGAALTSPAAPAAPLGGAKRAADGAGRASAGAAAPAASSAAAAAAEVGARAAGWVRAAAAPWVPWVRANLGEALLLCLVAELWLLLLAAATLGGAPPPPPPPLRCDWVWPAGCLPQDAATTLCALQPFHSKVHLTGPCVPSPLGLG